METIIAHPDPAKVLARTSQCMRLLLEAGLSFDSLQWPIDDPDFRQRLRMFWERRGADLSVEETESQRKAREIMGGNFLGLSEVATHFNFVPSGSVLEALAEVPFSEEVLKACRETHVLVAVTSLSILEIRSRVSRKLFSSHEDAWYNNQQFAQSTGITGWRLVRKEVVLGSTSKDWGQQQELLSDNEEIPSARVMVHAIMLLYLARGERMLESGYTRTSSVDSGDCHVNLGDFGKDGLGINYFWNNLHPYYLGLSSSRKQTLKT